jgi:hypothetical protein
VLRQQADVAQVAASSRDWTTRGRLVVDALREAAAASQSAIRRELGELGVRFRPYWIVNAIAIEGDRNALAAMAALPGVRTIEPDRAFRGVTNAAAERVAAAPASVGWNIAKINAPSVWQLGDTGEGLTYANADTGIAWEHPALKSHYRGWEGTATHDGNWWDAVHSDIDGSGSNRCGFSSMAPCDDDFKNSHGTHTMGTAVGDDGAGNQIGVAPGAKWIACRNMDEGTGRPSTYIECLQFFLAPTDLRGANPNPDKRPSVVGNSYGCPAEEGCSIDSLRAAVDAMRVAGVFMAVAAGNDGPNCATISLPPAVYDSSVTVGATDEGDAIAPFSSRGPVTADGSNRLKPDLVAPGVAIRSAQAGGAYGFLRGTSMAAPHVGGAVLLLWSAFPNLRGDIDRTEQFLAQGAVPLTTAEACGGLSSTAVPNNTYGYGRLDVLGAYKTAEAAFPPEFSIANVAAKEGDKGTTGLSLRVSLSRASTQTTTVDYATANGTASAGSDYAAASGTLTFASGEVSKTIAVSVAGDTRVERNETFVVRLSNPQHAGLAAAQATATIENDDVDTTPPVISRLSVSPPAVRSSASALIRFALSEEATVTFSIGRIQSGGSVRVGSLRRSGKKGANSFRLARRLGAGDYKLTATARDVAGNRGSAAIARFRVLR